MDVNALGAAGMQALQLGQAAEARRCFQQIVDAGQADIAVWLALALACLQGEDPTAAIAACDQVLAEDSQNLRALSVKGDALWDSGDQRGASAYYRTVIQFVGDPASLPVDMRTEVERIETRVRDFSDRMEAHLRSSLESNTTSSARFSEALDLLSGNVERQFQQPRTFFFPQLPCIDFYDVEGLSWAPNLMDQTPAIVAEVRSVLDQSPDKAFSPYIHSVDNKPVDARHPLLDNEDWSALFLVQNGEESDHAKRFPATLAALDEVPLERIPSRGPNILISRLAAKTRIAPHVGYLNTRLTCHIPIIVPDGCGIRVGNAKRTWTAGNLMVFNDSLNHEAWNDSNEDRYVLIFQVWRPELTAAECTQVAGLLQAVDQFKV